jgi:hypothetical protein
VKELSHLLNAAWDSTFIMNPSVTTSATNDTSCSQSMIFEKDGTLESVRRLSEILSFSTKQQQLLERLVSVHHDGGHWYSYTLGISVKSGPIQSIKEFTSQFHISFSHPESVNFANKLALGRSQTSAWEPTFLISLSTNENSMQYFNPWTVASRKTVYPGNHQFDFHVQNQIMIKGVPSNLTVIEPTSLNYRIVFHTFEYAVYQSTSNENSLVPSATSWKFIDGGKVAELPSFQITSYNCGEKNHKCFNSLVFDLAHLKHEGQYLLVLNYDGRKKIPVVSNIPPDAGFGIFISPTILQYAGRRYFANTSLLSRATPDTSMPYNVVTLVSTLFAFIVGSFINAWTRRSKK